MAVRINLTLLRIIKMAVRINFTPLRINKMAVKINFTPLIEDPNNPLIRMSSRKTVLS